MFLEKLNFLGDSLGLKIHVFLAAVQSAVSVDVDVDANSRFKDPALLCICLQGDLIAIFIINYSSL